MINAVNFTELSNSAFLIECISWGKKSEKNIDAIPSEYSRCYCVTHLILCSENNMKKNTQSFFLTWD